MADETLDTNEFGDFSVPKYKVYVQTNDDSAIIAVNSSAFISDTTNWTYIDEGVGDKYHHAQGNYFDIPIVDEMGSYNFKLVDGKPELRTDEEKAPQINRYNAVMRIAILKSQLDATDYIAAKLAEGVATKEEYADKLAEREAWRAEINEIQAQYGI